MQIQSELEVSRPYRDAVSSDPLFQYFKFPEYPEVLSEQTHHSILYATGHVLEVVRVATQLVLEDKIQMNGEPLWKMLDIPNHIYYWVKKFAQPDRSFIWGRPDFYLADNHPWMLETNIASAAGYQPQVSALVKYYKEHPALEQNFLDCSMRLTDPLINLCNGIGQVVRPNELVLFADIFESWRHRKGTVQPYYGMVKWIDENTDLRITSGFMHELEYKSDGVYLEGQKIDHVFMSYYNPHVFDRMQEFLPLWDLYQLGKVNILDNINEILMSNKLLMAFCSEHLDILPVSDEAKYVFDRHVPWTRAFRREKVLYKGDSVDLVEHVSRNKDLFVLKRAQSAEGKEVFVGKNVPSDNWRDQLEVAQSTGGYLVQEFIDTDPAKIWVPSESGYQEIDVEVSWSPYLANGQFAGYLNRYYQPNPEESLQNSSKKTRLEWLGTTAIQNDLC